ncbi:Gfo/Idh/MocA family oxidoreductase [Paenibacillus sp. JTLBN-2024]
MTKKMRFAIVGAGVISPLHARAIASHPEAELTAVVDEVQEKAEALAKEFGSPPTYRNMEQLLQGGRLTRSAYACRAGSTATLRWPRHGQENMCFAKSRWASRRRIWMR